MSLIPKERTKVSMQGQGNQGPGAGRERASERGGRYDPGEVAKSPRPTHGLGTVLAAGASRLTPRLASFLDTRSGSLHLRGSLSAPSKHPLYSVRSYTKPVPSPPVEGTRTCFTGPPPTPPRAPAAPSTGLGTHGHLLAVLILEYSQWRGKKHKLSKQKEIPQIMEIWIQT